VQRQVGIVVLNWNNANDTIECIKSILMIKHTRYQLYVVDNFSTDNSIETICRYLQKIKAHYRRVNELDLERVRLEKFRVIIVRSDSNKGYSGGNNIAIKFIVSKNLADYIWILNNDTIVGENALTSMVEMADSEPRIGIVGSKILDYYNKEQIRTAGGGRVDCQRGITKHIAMFEPQDWNGPVMMDYVTGASMLIKKELIEGIGSLDEGYFLYWEDVDYSFRAVEHGYKLAYCKDSLVWHKESATTGRDLVRLYYWYRNALYFFKTHKPPNYQKTIIRLIVRAIRFSFKDHSNAKYYRSAIRNFLFNMKGKYV
jgi:GT2 family glycosyltransferase